MPIQGLSSPANMAGNIQEFLEDILRKATRLSANIIDSCLKSDLTREVIVNTRAAKNNWLFTLHKCGVRTSILPRPGHYSFEPYLVCCRLS